MPCGCHGRDVSHGHRFGTAHGRLALHHFFRKIPRSRPYDSHREFCHRRYDDGREPGRV
jgi:hypothetical protein